MEMQMLDGLAALVSRVRDDAEALLRNAELLRELWDDVDEDVRDERLVLLPEREHALDVPLRDHEHMHGRLRLEIIERDALVILIDEGRRNLFRCNLAENAIGHDGHHLSKLLRYVTFIREKASHSFLLMRKICTKITGLLQLLDRFYIHLLPNVPYTEAFPHGEGGAAGDGKGVEGRA